MLLLKIFLLRRRRKIIEKDTFPSNSKHGEPVPAPSSDFYKVISAIMSIVVILLAKVLLQMVHVYVNLSVFIEVFLFHETM